MEKKQLGEFLISEGLLNQEQLQNALEQQSSTGARLGEILTDLGYVRSADITRFLAKQLDIPYMEIKNFVVDTEVLELISEATARRFEIMPLYKSQNKLTVAMINPFDVFAVDALENESGCEILQVAACEDDVKSLIDQYYGGKQDTLDQLIKSIDTFDLPSVTTRSGDEAISVDIAKEAPIIKLVNKVLYDAVQAGASDIHLEPEPDRLRIRFRVDGILSLAHTTPRELQSPIVTRIKVMGNMDISQKRIPQDGRFEVRIGQNEVDARISSIPTIYGEKIVIRLLNKSTTSYKLEDLGFSENNLDVFKKIIRTPHGIILVAGPTGSGKSTTLYCALNKITSMQINVVTVEDPVEYEVKLVNQIQLNPKAGLHFSNTLRSILRQDPDVIMIGEIRDLDTAQIAIQAALTGHLVFSTLHTNDSVEALTRLIDIGVEPFLISASLQGVLAQRLVRKVCDSCKEAAEVEKSVLEDMGLDPKTTENKFFRGAGCPECRHTGYKGRIGLFELLVIDRDLRSKIVNRAHSDDVKEYAIKHGLITLRQDGLEKAKAGVTTLEEILRVTREVEI